MSEVLHIKPRVATVDWAEGAKSLLAGAVYFAGASIVGVLVFIALFQVGALGGMAILFYRGIALAIVASLVVLGLGVTLAPRFGSSRDAVAAAALVFGLNLSVLTIAPVTIDRSVSIFLLGYMDERPGRTFSTTELDQAFRDVYLTRMRQVERRMLEQQVTGHIERHGDGWRLTPQGHAFVRTAKGIGAAFDVDTILLNPTTPR